MNRFFGLGAVLLLVGLCASAAEGGRGTTVALGQGDSATAWTIPVFSQVLALPLSEGWKPSFQNSSDDSFIKEFLPQQESPAEWHEKITVQGYRALRKLSGTSAEGYLARRAALFKKVCGKDAVVSFLGKRQVAGYDGFAAILGCARVDLAATVGHGEIGYYLAFMGKDDLYVVRRSSRVPAFDPEDPPITEYNVAPLAAQVESVWVCERGESAGSAVGQCGAVP